MKKTVVIFAALINFGTVFADTEIVDDVEWNYSISNGVATLIEDISLWNNMFEEVKAITVPSVLGGCPVATIDERAIPCYDTITSITIPDSVTEINCGAFAGCSSLSSIYVAKKNPSYCDIDGVLYTKDRRVLVASPIANASVVIPDGVIAIGEDAFTGCSALTSIEIPTSVTTIGAFAFLSCKELTSIAIPSSVVNIGMCAFGGCTSLKTIYVELGDRVRVRNLVNGCLMLGDAINPEFKVNLVNVLNDISEDKLVIMAEEAKSGDAGCARVLGCVFERGYGKKRGERAGDRACLERALPFYELALKNGDKESVHDVDRIKKAISQSITNEKYCLIFGVVGILAVIALAIWLISVRRRKSVKKANKRPFERLLHGVIMIGCIAATRVAKLVTNNPTKNNILILVGIGVIVVLAIILSLFCIISRNFRDLSDRADCKK